MPKDVFAIPSAPLDAHFARAGGVIIANTATHTGPFFALQALADSIIATATLGSGWTGSLAGVALAKGQVLVLPIKSLSLTSGTVAAARQVKA